MASPAAAGEQQCQSAAHDHLPHVSAAGAAKACKQAAGGDVDGCVATLQKAGKGKDAEGSARAACIAAAY
jgi:hypothetical protein